MHITDALIGEHGVLHLLVEQLDDAAERRGTVAELRAAAEPIAIAILAHHRAEEETLLAPYERQKGSLGPLKCLRHEHQILDGMIRGLFVTDGLDETRGRVRQLVDHVRRHFAREEQLLFAHVREALPATDLEHLGAHWAEFRGVSLPK